MLEWLPPMVSYEGKPSYSNVDLWNATFLVASGTHETG